LTGQHPHGEAKQADPAGGDTCTTLHSASSRHSARAGFATHRPASHAARKLETGSGTTAAHTPPQDFVRSQSTTRQRSVTTFSAAALIA
jgi:hypothetical protein